MNPRAVVKVTAYAFCDIVVWMTPRGEDVAPELD
jgi:hypothetical protein